MLQGVVVVMLSTVPSGTGFQPTPEQLQVLQTASEFAYQVWQSRTGACQTFLRSYPLQSTLTRQQIEDLIQDYTLDENYQLRSEERRVGKECRSRWCAEECKKEVD